MRVGRVLCIVFLVVVACSDVQERAAPPDSTGPSSVASELPEARSVTAEADSRGVFITKAEYGGDWPYTIESGLLYCDPPGSNVVMESGGKVFALNGRAMGNAAERGYVIAREAITLRDEYGYFTVGDPQKIISRGLSMCN